MTNSHRGPMDSTVDFPPGFAHDLLQRVLTNQTTADQTVSEKEGKHADLAPVSESGALQSTKETRK